MSCANRISAAVAALLVGALLAAGCAETSAPTATPERSGRTGPEVGSTEPAAGTSSAPPRAPKPRVAAIGDSLTENIEPHLHQRLDPTHDLRVDATRGAKTPEMLAAAQAVAPERPDIVIINLGTNDAWHDRPREETDAAYRSIVDLFPDSCLVLVTIIDSTPGLDPNLPYHPDAAADLNALIRAYETSERHAVIADWARTVRGHELEYTFTTPRPKVYIRPDGIHQSDRGMEVMADVVTAGVTTCTSRRTGTT